MIIVLNNKSCKTTDGSEVKRCRSSKEAANRLSRPALRSPWIAAINAYNPSIDYNNRVADAANHYATLR